jgi:hypothetical protein
MGSFNSYLKYRHFDWNAFYTSWQKMIIGTEDFSTLEGEKKRSESDRLRDRIKTLWKSFNENRDEFTKKYSDEKKFVAAYISSFYMPNIQRTFAILTNRQNAHLLKNICKCQDELVILDFGAGPLSATAGFLISLDFAGIDLTGKKIKIMSVERSANMLNAGFELLKAAFPSLEIEHNNYSSALKVPEKADIILCANVFNEIPEKHRLVTLESLLDVMKGNLLIIEPGQDVHSRSLSSLRNALLKERPGKFRILSPCLHTLECPLSSESERTDWCWFKNTWYVPEAVAFIDRITGIDHRQLNYSYLFIDNNEPSVPQKGWKVISDIILPVGPNNRSRFENWMRNNIIEGNAKCLFHVQNGNVGKVLLCSHDGKLSSIIGNKDFLAPAKRGFVINAVPQGTCMCKER